MACNTSALSKIEPVLERLLQACCEVEAVAKGVSLNVMEGSTSNDVGGP